MYKNKDMFVHSGVAASFKNGSTRSSTLAAAFLAQVSNSIRAIIRFRCFFGIKNYNTNA